MTAVPIGGFTSLTIEAPLKETSMTRQLCTSPFGKINLEDGLRGTMRSCRRSSESELIGDLLALMQARHGGETAVHRAGHHGLDPPEMIQVGHDAFAYLTSDRGWEGHATRRHVDDLARMILLVLAHEAAGDANWHTAYRRRSGTIFGLTWSAWARLRRVGMGSAGAGAPSRRLMLMRLGRCSGSSRSLWLSRGSMGLALSE